MKKKNTLLLLVAIILISLPATNALEVLNETFDRANSATVGNGWTEVESTNTFKIESNTLEMITTAPALSIMYKNITNLTEFTASWQVTYNTFAQSYQLWINAPDNSTELGYRFLHDDNLDTLGIAAKNGTHLAFENHAGWAAPIDNGETWLFELSKNATHLRLKLWQNNDTEPADYNMSIYVANLTMQNLDNVKWHLGNGAPAGIDINVDNLYINDSSVDQNAIIARAFDNVTNNALSNFTVRIFDNASNLLYTNHTNGTNIQYYGLSAGNYTLELTKEGYIYDGNKTTEFLNTSDVYVDWYLNKVPSVNVTIYDLSNNLITDGVNLEFIGLSEYYFNTTTTGNFYTESSILPDYYRLDVSSANYQSQSYYVNLTETTAAQIIVYLQNSSGLSNRTYTIQDSGSQAIENALITIFKRINGTFTQVEQKRTNVVGKANFFLDDNSEHLFLIEANNFQTKTFTIFPTEDLIITLSSSTTVTYTTVYDTISYTYSPTDYEIPNESQIFNFTISSSSSNLDYWGITGLGNTTQQSGASGGVATLNLNLNSYSLQQIRINYYFKPFNEELVNISKTYYVVNFSPDNSTATGNFANNFNFSTGGKIILAFAMIIFLVVWFASTGLPSIALGFAAVFGVVMFTVLGWIPIFLGVIIGVLAVIAMIFKGGGA